MKGPWIAAGGVLALGCAWALWQQSQVVILEKELDQLQQEAERQGIPLRMSASVGRRSRGNEDRNAARLVHKVTGLLERAEWIERSGGRPDEALRDQIVQATVELMELSPSNMRKVLAKLRVNPSLSDDTKSKVIGFSLLYVSGEHPEAALRLVEESKDLLGKGSMVNHVVGNALQSWAQKNPEAALQWLQVNQTPPAGMSIEEMQHAVLGGAAQYDPATAFQLLEKMGLDVSPDACEVIASTLADSQKGREAVLSAMRGYIAEIESERSAQKVVSAVMEAVARGVGKNSFEEVSKWLDSESVGEEELASFAGGLSWFSTGDETGSWLDWMSQRISGDKLAEPVESMVGDWVEADYLAAGKWLTQVPPGPIKTPATKAYAEAVAAYDPEVATQWAMTITDSAAKKETLRVIHENWPAEDEAGAAKFAAQHGLE